MPFDKVEKPGMLGRKDRELRDAMEAVSGGDTRRPREDDEPEYKSEEWYRRRERDFKRDTER